MIFLLRKAAVFGCGLVLLAAAARAEVVDGNRIMDQDMSENLCALTFDDGPSRNTPMLLDMLADYGIPATFFLLGKNASYYPEIVRRMTREGHEIGNHSWSHPNLRNMSSDGIKWQIEKTDALLRSLGAGPLYMRPPYGAFDDRVIKIARDLGLSLVLWSLDSRDWKRLPEDYSKVISTRGTVYEDGALRGIFLFHDTRKTTVEDLPRIIDNLRAGGCERFVTISDYLAGILDPEPPLLLSRHKTRGEEAINKNKIQPAQSGSTRLARCSKPWRGASQKLDNARVDAGDLSAGLCEDNGLQTGRQP